MMGTFIKNWQQEGVEMKAILNLFYTLTYSLDRSSIFISELILVSGTY